MRELLIIGGKEEENRALGPLQLDDNFFNKLNNVCHAV